MSLPFERITSPVSPGDFVAVYKAKQYLYCDGQGDGARFADVLSWESLSEMLARLATVPGSIRVYNQGQHVPPDTYLRPALGSGNTGRSVSASALAGLLAAGATLIVEHSQSYFHVIGQYCRMLSEVFGSRVNATIFVVCKPDAPMGLHWHGHDMFIFQIDGYKRWPLYAPSVRDPIDSPFVDETRIRHTTTLVLKPGDALYVPRGWGHNPASQSGASLHVAFGFVRPTGKDFLAMVLSKAVEASASVRADLPLRTSSEARSRYLEGLRAAIAHELTESAFSLYCEFQEGLLESKSLQLPALDIS